MNRLWPVCLFLLAGCSTHPIVNVRDYFCPGRLTKEEVPPYGGVCRPQGPVVGPATPPGVAPSLGPGVIPPGVPPISVVPPPVPLPPPSTPPPPPPPSPPGFPKF